MPRLMLATVLGLPDFRDGIAQWNASREARFLSLNPVIGNLETVISYTNFPTLWRKAIWVRTMKFCDYVRRNRRRCVFWPLQGSCRRIFAGRHTPAAREAHMLEGLLRTCVYEPNYVLHIGCIPSISPSRLWKWTTARFLTLLKRYVPNGGSVI
ncbi:hypothetical protein B0H19DRAFT_1224594 [Mycena capillaripes]|nr:hypothetical protein B0H19DRAFT_1224594 [Mycena capillaripes]